MTIIDDIAEAKKQFSKSDYHAMKEFKLSDFNNDLSEEDCPTSDYDFIRTKHVKEFIKEVKEKIFEAQENYANLDWIYKESAIKIIDESVGDLEKEKEK